jgi:Type I phosphodiesterase / nucleotide pyrophosphatase
LSISRKYFSVLMAAALSASTALPQNWGADDHGKIKHVLLISIDGMHAVDFLNCSNGIGGSSGPNGGAPYCPALAALGATGITYQNASTSKPSDSFPGLTAIVSGGGPKSNGVYYDVSYDRVLAPPTIQTGNGLKGGNCIAGQANGTSTEFEEGIDINQNYLTGGNPNAANGYDATAASIDPQKLPRNPYNNCAPVYPWNFVRDNTIFGVIHDNGGYTAWSDKHPAYSSVNGPGNGNNVNDFFGPEINSVANPSDPTQDAAATANQAAVSKIVTALGESCSTLDLSSSVNQWTDSFFDIRCYDQIKVNAVVNEIQGMNHLGTAKTKVPTILGMNFQAVSVGQKLIEKDTASGTITGGYLDAEGTPTATLLKEIEFADASIGQMVKALKSQGIYDSTLIVITAKHGQSPIDPKLYYPLPGPSGANGTSPVTLLGSSYIPDSELNQIGPTEDDISLIWLSPGASTLNAVNMLEGASKTPGTPAYIGLGQIFYGASLASMIDTPGIPPYGDAPTADADPRTPDIIVTPNVGIVYTGSSKKQMEHGGFAHDDTNVMMLLSNPSFSPKLYSGPVETMQVAPTILKALGLDPRALVAVQNEGTQVLPAVQFNAGDDR